MQLSEAVTGNAAFCVQVVAVLGNDIRHQFSGEQMADDSVCERGLEQLVAQIAIVIVQRGEWGV